MLLNEHDDGGDNDLYTGYDDRVIGIETCSTITKAFPAMVMVKKKNKKKGGFDKQ